MKNSALILELLILFTSRLQSLQLLLQKAQAEGRDISKEELDSLVAEDDTARAELDAAIARAEAEGR